MKRTYSATSGIRNLASAVAMAPVMRALSMAGHTFRGYGPKTRTVSVISAVASLAFFSYLLTLWTAPNIQRMPRGLHYAMVSEMKPLAIGFYVNWDGKSYLSLR